MRSFCAGFVSVVYNPTWDPSLYKEPRRASEDQIVAIGVPASTDAHEGLRKTLSIFDAKLAETDGARNPRLCRQPAESWPGAASDPDFLELGATEYFHGPSTLAGFMQLGKLGFWSAA